MKNFTYYQPTTVAQAVGLLEAQYGKAELLAGGTDLHDLQKEYVARPDKVISLTGIKELSGIKLLRTKGESEDYEIGAATKLAEIAEHKELRKLAPGLTTAAGMVGGPQIRNMGTLGGNLCQRNRCWYFRDEEVKCLLKGGEKCYALPNDAENRYHAVFTQGCKCVIVNPSTIAPVLIALGASVTIAGPGAAKRTVKLEELYQNPTSAETREHTLKANELITAVTIPATSGMMPKNASYEVRQKQSYDWPLAQAAVAFALEGGKAKNVRIVLGHVAPSPVLSADAAAALEGKEVTEATADAAGKAATKGAKPLSQNGYKLRLIEVAVKRAAIEAAGGKKYWEG